MKIILNDANILIDLVKLDLMNEFILLEFDLKTTDVVYDELNDNQKFIIESYINSGYIELIITEELDYNGIEIIFKNSLGLSFEDCSVWYYGNKLNSTLLTGDGKLKKQAMVNGVNVKGILFIFDQLLLRSLITFEYANEKLNQLYEINPRLPISSKNE